jgi:hypothetical protein
MKLSDLTVREVGGRRRPAADGAVEIWNSASPTWQLVELRDDAFAGRWLRFAARLRPLGTPDGDFCLHHFGNVDILRVSPAGEIVDRDSRYVQSAKVTQQGDGAFALEVEFHCAEPGFSFGTAAPASLYVGSAAPQFVMRDLSVEVSSVVGFRQQLHVPDTAPPPAAPPAAGSRPIRLVIPVHPPKAIWLTQMLLSLERSALATQTPLCEIVLLLTSRDDFTFFQQLCATLRLVSPVQALLISEYLAGEGALPKTLAHLRAGANGAMAVMKKLVGLLALARGDETDTLNICIDCDTFCIGWDAGFAELAEKNYRDGRYFGAPVGDGTAYPAEKWDYPRVNAVSVDQVSGGGSLPLPAEAKGVYTWFFDMPIYGSFDFVKFMEHAGATVGGVDAFLSRIVWHAFEHTMFSAYMAAQGNRIVSYQPIDWRVPEDLPIGELVKVTETFDYRPLWVHAGAYFHSPDRARKTLRPYFLYHFDRFRLQS